MKTKTKMLSTALIIFSLLTLSGCGSANVGVNTSLEKDGSGSLTYKLSTTGIFAQTNPSAEQQKEKNKAKDTDKEVFKGMLDKVESKKYRDGEKNIEEKTVKFKNVQELNSLFKDAKDNDLSVSISENKQLFKTTYAYKMKLPKEFSMESMQKEIAKQKESTEALGITNDQIIGFIGQAISFSASIKLPGKVVEQNATSVNGNTLKWDYALSQVNPNNVMSATCEVKNERNIYIATGVSISILAVIGFIAFKKIKKSK